MPENARQPAAGLFDQFQDEHPIADWGGDELFTRMPRPRPVDDAPAPRFRPSHVVSETSAAAAPERRAPRPLVLVPPDITPAPMPERRFAGSGDDPMPERRFAGSGDDPMPERRFARRGEAAMRERAERLGLAVVEPMHRFDESGSLIEAEPGERETKVITGHPGAVPRPLPVVRSGRRRPSRTPVEWIGARPERIVGWAFALGLLLILIAISTADAATF